MINTVIKNIGKQYQGRVLFHEHIQCISNDMLHIFGNDWRDKDKLIDFAVEILSKLKETYGVEMIVDGTPIDLGRDVRLLKSVSEKSGVDIVASTGLYYFPNYYTSGNSENEIASWFIREYKSGMENSGIKPGVLKCASEGGISNDNKKRLKAVAIAQKETGLPIYVHSSHNENIANEQISILLDIMTVPEKIVIGHAARRADSEYLKSILDKGCYIVMDQCHCVPYDAIHIGKVLAELCNSGYSDKILLSNDLCIYSDFPDREHTGFELSVDEQVNNFGYLFEKVYLGFRESGGSGEQWEDMLRKNPLKALDLK